MSSILILLLVTALACVVTMLVLFSLVRSGIEGVREWMIANILTFVSLILFVLRGVAPDLLSLVCANVLLAAAICTALAGFRRFLHQPLPKAWMLTGLTLLAVGVVVFHYVLDRVMIRIVIVSAFHSAACFVIARTVFSRPAMSPIRYPAIFTGTAAAIFGIAHAVRALVYLSGVDILISNMRETSWNIVFVSIGVMVLPTLTLGAILMVHDRMMTQAEQTANSDFLTGALSRRAFFASAAKEVARQQRTGNRLSLLVLDVDHFKSINDKYGHATGDHVLAHLAHQATRALRNVDYFGRLGGEEFAVLLPDAGEDEARLVAERLRSSLASRDDEKPSASVSYTVSIGVAEFDQGESFNQLLQRADGALYEAKHRGRDKVMTAAGAISP